MTPKATARFWRKVLRLGPDECWPWQAGADPRGYGRFFHDGRLDWAHRVAYETLWGAGSAQGWQIRHRCDNPPCCNPRHLLRGTHADNMNDAKVRRKSARGERHGSSKLTDAQVLMIRASELPPSTLAKMFKVTTVTIWRIRKGRRGG